MEFIIYSPLLILFLRIGSLSWINGVGNPERNRKKLIEYSPITYVDCMSKPMLIIQRANNPCVVKVE